MTPTQDPYKRPPYYKVSHKVIDLWQDKSRKFEFDTVCIGSEFESLKAAAFEGSRRTSSIRPAKFSIQREDSL